MSNEIFLSTAMSVRPISANVWRLMAVGLLEHSTFLTDKRLFKDTNVY